MTKRRKIVGTGDLVARVERRPEGLAVNDRIVVPVGHYGRERFVERTRLHVLVGWLSAYPEMGGAFNGTASRGRILRFRRIESPPWDAGALVAML